MATRRRPHIEAVMTFLRQAGAHHVRLDHGSKHPHVRYQWHGTEHFYTLSLSPRCVEAAGRMSIQHLRTLLNLRVKRGGEAWRRSRQSGPSAQATRLSRRGKR
jgi:hypothetical protein